MNKNISSRKKRHLRARKKVIGSAARPRLNVFRSAKHIYAQLVDDATGTTLGAYSSQTPAFKEKGIYGGNATAAKEVGTQIAKIALDKGINNVVFDRGGYIYHGRVKALAEGAREAGLQF